MIHHGDCLDVMSGMDPESVDAIVTDPPSTDPASRSCDECAGPSGCWEDPRGCPHECHGPGGFP